MRAITVNNVSKHYRLGTAGPKGRYGTLRESLMEAAAAPVRGLRSFARGGWRRGEKDESESSLWALKGVSFDVTPGESVGVIGRNGAGKSTLLKILSRVTAPTAGELELRGRVGSLLEVGTGFHPELTGRENIFLNGAIIGMTRKEIARKFADIVEFSEVGKFIDTPVKRYSSGMYVKLAFSVAAHMEPDILLIDEVLSVGDLAFQRKCMDHAKKMLDRNTTLLFVSHNMFSIKAMCDRAIYLAQGQLAMDGSPEEVTKLYDEDSRLDVAPWALAKVGSDPSKCAIQITGVDLLDEAGNSRTIFDHGRPMRVRLSYHARRPVEAPNFAVSFIRSDDTPCCNYNCAMDGFATGTVQGDGVIEVAIPPLKLIADLYAVHVMVWDQKFQNLYCAQVGRNFHVKDEVLSGAFGIFHERATWSWGAGPGAGAAAGVGAAS